MSERMDLNVKHSSAIKRPVVRLQDVAEVFCENKSVQKQVQKLILTEFKGNQEAKQVFSACYLIRQISAAVPNCQVESIGETAFIVYYKPIGKQAKWKDRLKGILVGLQAFFGAAFSIMTFTIVYRTGSGWTGCAAGSIFGWPFSGNHPVLQSWRKI